MYDLKQSTALTIPIFCHDANGDAVTGLLNAGFTKRISKNGGAFAAMTVTITEMENGWYSVPVSALHSDTLGVLSMTFTHASCKQVNIQVRVHARINDDLSYHADPDPSNYIDAAISTRSSHGDPDPSGFIDIAVSSRSSHGDPDPSGHIDAAISSRQPSGNVTVAGYAVGQDPADHVLVTPANKLATDVSGRVTEVVVDGVEKNAALNNFEFLMVDATDGYTAEPGLTVTAQRSIDGAAFAACANAVTEVGLGIYKINLAATDLNGDVITFRFSSTGARDRFITIKTNE